MADKRPGSIQWSPPGARGCFKDKTMTPNLSRLVLDLRRGGLHFVTLVKDKGQKPLVPGLETLAHFLASGWESRREQNID